MVSVALAQKAVESALHRILTKATDNGEEVCPVRSPAGQINMLKSLDIKFMSNDTMLQSALGFMYHVTGL